MREFVYLSERKLALFELDRRQRRRRPSVEGNIGILGIGGLKVGPPPPETGATNQLPDVDAIVAALGNSGREPRPFTDRDLRTGQWVRFAAPLTYMQEGGTVVFVDSPEATAVYPSGGSLRLVLHGSTGGLTRPNSTCSGSPNQGSCFHTLWRLARTLEPVGAQGYRDGPEIDNREVGDRELVQALSILVGIFDLRMYHLTPLG
jgi:hypothetical protein